MAYRYLYIDDTKDKIEQGTINGLEDGGEIEVKFRFPNNWETLVNELIGDLPQFNGIILDLRLNDNPYAEGKYAQYRGSSIAQELRTLAKENTIKNDFPIILISANQNLEKSLDTTSIDLFDMLISKNTVGNELSYQLFKDKLKWLADGYHYLNNSEKSINSILRVPENLELDLRFTDQFNKLLEKPIIHVVARFLIKEVIEKKSFLLNESYVLARLGIEKSSEDWRAFESSCLKAARYQGAFSNFFPRWWRSSLEKFWENQISQEVNLRNATAVERVQLIIEKTGFKNLKPIQRSENSKSDSFWVVCKVTNVPIDTIDGFTIAGQENNYPWQEREYISIKEALRPTKNFTVASSEKPRLQKLKELFEKNEQRVRK